MIEKLGLKNAGKSFSDYLIYVATMAMITALMLSFNSLLFSKEIQEMSEMFSIMAVLLLIATVFIILIVAWLVHYMIVFSFQRKSKEFAIYMLLGMKKQEIAQIYFTENLILGGISFLIGTVAGIFLQQILMSIFHSMMNTAYTVPVTIHIPSLLLTFLCYFACFTVALLLNHRKFKTMQFTMGTLSLLFVCAFIGMSVSLMLNDWQNKQLEENFPFDISIHNASPSWSFEPEIKEIEQSAGIKESHSSRIFENHSTEFNDYFYTHLPAFGDKYAGRKEIVPSGYDKAYFRYDTFMKLSDYNALRSMLGYGTVLSEWT